MEKFSKSLIGVISILVAVGISELFLLNQNFALKKKISEYYQLEILLTDMKKYNEKMHQLFELEGRALPVFLEQAINNPASGAMTVKSAYAILFIFSFSLNSCDRCVTSEISTWNEFSKLYGPQSIQVIGITESKDAVGSAQLRKRLIIKFPVIFVDDLTQKLESSGIHSTPVVLFVSPNTRRCIYAFFPDLTEKSEERFAKKLQRFLDTGGKKLISSL